MTLDAVIATATMRLDIDISNAASEFESALLDSGNTAEVIAEACEWYRQELQLWRTRTLDQLRTWLMAWPESVH